MAQKVLTDWGWSEIYRDDYGLSNVSYDDIFSGHGDCIMLGGIQDNSDTIDVLAAISWVWVSQGLDSPDAPGPAKPIA